MMEEFKKLADAPTLSRWGITWQGPESPICVPMNDGYWTPWHLAQNEIDALNHAVRAESDYVEKLKEENAALKTEIEQLRKDAQERITIKRANSSDIAYKVFLNDSRIGEITLQDDGSYQWWPYKEPGTPGYWSADVLRLVADKIDELERKQ